ncbi:MAG: type I methionyl aminopeptidase [Clostridia bacterium]|nr:type I methionyl aminopeptidase [Clostridia bacterium]
MCASKNEQVVHGFCDDEPLQEGDIISIDCGCIWQGYHADAARTFPVGNISLEKQKLIEATKQSFFEGIKDIKAGSRLGHISHRVQTYLEERGYGVVRELVGHGVGTELHEDPMVPNFGKYNSGITLEEGMTLAIEPMSTMGKRDVYLEDNDWTVTTQDGLPSAHYENTILITKDGVEILTL